MRLLGAEQEHSIMQGLHQFHYCCSSEHFGRFQRQSRPQVLARVGRAGLLAAQVIIRVLKLLHFCCQCFVVNGGPGDNTCLETPAILLSKLIPLFLQAALQLSRSEVSTRRGGGNALNGGAVNFGASTSSRQVLLMMIMIFTIVHSN